MVFDLVCSCPGLRPPPLCQPQPLPRASYGSGSARGLTSLHCLSVFTGGKQDLCLEQEGKIELVSRGSWGNSIRDCFIRVVVSWPGRVVAWEGLTGQLLTKYSQFAPHHLRRRDHIDWARPKVNSIQFSHRRLTLARPPLGLTSSLSCSRWADTAGLRAVGGERSTGRPDPTRPGLIPPHQRTSPHCFITVYIRP